MSAPGFSVADGDADGDADPEGDAKGEGDAGGAATDEACDPRLTATAIPPPASNTTTTAPTIDHNNFRFRTAEQ